MQIVFTAGIKDFLLAEEGLNTLEDWCLIFPEEDIKHILNSIVPYFIPYLKNKRKYSYVTCYFEIILKVQNKYKNIHFFYFFI